MIISETIPTDIPEIEGTFFISPEAYQDILNWSKDTLSTTDSDDKYFEIIWGFSKEWWDWLDTADLGAYNATELSR
jgi:hypothetical protein